MRKTPPGRAVIVAGGFCSGPIGVLPEVGDSGLAQVQQDRKVNGHVAALAR